MKRIFFPFALVLSIVFIVSILTAQTPSAKYVGSAKCKMCHMNKAKGDQFAIWQNSTHAKAYTVLATEEAKAVAKKAGIAGDPQKEPKCLKCHVTGYDAPAAAKDVSFTMEEGVGCEACHGPGSLYKAMKVMKDLKAGTQDAKAVAFLKGDEATCKKCHNEQSPTYKPFTYTEAYKKIAHNMPAAK